MAWAARLLSIRCSLKAEKGRRLFWRPGKPACGQVRFKSFASTLKPLTLLLTGDNERDLDRLLRRRRRPERLNKYSTVGRDVLTSASLFPSFMSLSAMEISHAPSLSRMHTAPQLTGRTTSMNPYPSSMGHAPRTSQLSGATAFSSASSTSISSMSSSATLVPPTSSAPVIATNNIINQKADASRSLYQICVNLRQRLRQVPSFEQHLIETDDEDEGEVEMDPMSSLWRCLRKGYPLITIYNGLQPAVPLKIPDTIKAKNIPKDAAFKFVQACLKELKFYDCFVLSDLFGDDTTGFVKVTQVINKVLDIAESQGLLSAPVSEVIETVSTGGGQMSYRDHVVRELVDTERKYVQDLENLHELKKIIEQKGVIPGDVVHAIFLNINAILDFQRRFLIRIETANSQPDEKQEWGLIFVNYEDAFNIYQPFIANQRKAASIAKKEFEKITLANHPVVVDFNTLDGFLLKPMQRLVKYPQLLKSLRDKTATDEHTKADLTAGIEAAERVLEQANAAVDRELRNEALVELCALVEDWKNHEVGQFGDLILHGQFTVVTGKTDVEKEYTIYLFERILLCCKEINPNKATKDKLLSSQKEKKERKEKEKRDRKEKNGKPLKLQLKGRIFMTNVTDVISLVKPGSYTLQIWWKGDPGIENFIIRFSHEEVMKKWSMAVDAQRKLCTIDRELVAAGESAASDFTWIRDHASAMPNPYVQQEEEEDEDVGGNSPVHAGQSGFDTSRNASSTSLRSRSTTGESSQSLAGKVRAPLRFPMNPPLSLQTHLLGQGQVPSPSQRGGDSYFSPVADSPSSSRTSQTSMFPFPRQGTPKGGWEDHRYTAPAITRAPSRESSTPPTGYQMNGRNPQRPSLPAMASQTSQATSAQQRSRSYSTPDINGPSGPARRLPNGATVPAVPGIPAHLHSAYDGSIIRSSSSSPSNALPMRANTQSPGVQRERLAQHLNASQYLRPNTTTPVSSSGLESRTMSPAVPNVVSPMGEMPLPTQLKVKVNCDGNYVTLVVAFNITYQSLIDRIDAKVGRFSNNAIARGTMRLRYRDEDGDFVTIQSDEDIQIAFQDWREVQKNQFHTGQLGEIELFCASVEN